MIPNELVRTRALVMAGQYAEAALASGASRAAVEDANVLNLLGLEFDKFADNEAALRCLERALELDPTNGDVLQSLGRFFARCGNADKALAFFEKALPCFERPPAGFYQAYGSALAVKGELSRAKAMLEKAIEIEPETAYFHLSLGKFLEEHDDIEKAEACYREAIRRRLDWHPPYFHLSSLLENCNRFDEAFTALKEAEQHMPANAAVRAQIAMFLLRRNRHREAADCFAEAIRLDNSAPTLWFALLGKTLRFSDRIVEARQVLIDAISRFPDSPPLHMNLAELFEQEGKKSEALKHYDRVLDLDPANGEAMEGVLRLFLTEEDISAAVRRFERICQTDITLAESAVVSFVEKLTALGELDKAVRVSSIALSRNPNQSSLLVRLGRAYRTRGDFKLAAQAFRTAVELNPRLGLGAFQELEDVTRRTTGRRQAWYEFIPGGILKGSGYLSLLWKDLNSPLPQMVELVKSCYPENIDEEDAYLYFAKTNAFQTLYLESLTDKDLKLLEGSGISAKHLYANRSEVLDQKTSVKKSDPAEVISPSDIDQHLREAEECFRDRLHALEETQLSAVCPFSGQVLYSDRAFVAQGAVFHRFVGKEVFYLAVVPNHRFSRELMYFPMTDIVVSLDPKASRSASYAVDILSRFKAILVANWQKVVSYLHNTSRPKRAVMIGCGGALRYHLIRDLSAVSALERNDALGSIDRLYLNSFEAFGPVEELFSEVDPGCLVRLGPSSAARKALEENWFTVALGHCWLSDDVATRLINTSRCKCSAETLAEIDEARKYYPLLWINLRTHNQQWISQIEGFAALLNALRADFADTAVVFDGHTRTLMPDGSLSDRRSEFMSAEKAVVRRICELLPIDFPIYDKIGIAMHESITWAAAVDCYAIYFGSAALKPQLLARKPGISFGAPPWQTRDFASTNWAWVCRENGVPSDIVSAQPVTGTDIREGFGDFEMDWRILYRKLKDIIAKIPPRR